MIDVTKPMELSDGRKATYIRHDFDNDIVVEVAGVRSDRFFNPFTGVHQFGELPDLRNVAEPAAQPVNERALKLVGELAKYEPTQDYPIGNVPMLASHVTEARAIMAELRPVDPVMLKARELVLAVKSHTPDPEYVRYLNEGRYDDYDEVKAFADAIRVGMTMAVQS